MFNIVGIFANIIIVLVLVIVLIIIDSVSSVLPESSNLTQTNKV